MAEPFVTPASERTTKLYSEAQSPTELYEIAMKELHEHRGTPETPTAPSAPAPLPAGPVDHRASGFYRIVYPSGNDRFEVTADSEEELQKKIERIYQMYKR